MLSMKILEKQNNFAKVEFKSDNKIYRIRVLRFDGRTYSKIYEGEPGVIKFDLINKYPIYKVEEINNAGRVITTVGINFKVIKDTAEQKNTQEDKTTKKHKASKK